MGNELADAIRGELRSALLAKYGTLEAAAEALGIPYKTLRRHLTTAGKDRTARVPLDFVLDVAEHLGAVSNVDFTEIYRRASLSVNVPSSLDDLELRPPRSYDLAADKRDLTENDLPAPGEEPEDF